ncbi:Transketolase [Arcticibacter svalbardensis MN12-7]|uniref:Transketolase n=1 Tax=Arcticibacter svalbardensis MN12-7 TaxID=1150600 RepID=R9GXE5_9SPHI|nr:transketolase [Arcticibacter svalbardensis]EOR93629.1 Transketolase [Arcticibacter svalbardensis MN12-7]
MTEKPFTPLDELSVNTIRFLSIDMVQKANSGHPGLPLGAAPMAYVLWNRFLKFNPQNTHWPNHDRFILSAGHGSALLYSLIHLSGYDLPMEELKRFRQLGSKTPGHPESLLTPGIEVTTGPLGQGFGNGVGVAIAEEFIASKFNREGHEIMNHYTYGIVSDGDLMEGVASEAASLAGHLQLGKLIYLYDDNLISLDGPTNLSFTEDVLARFNAYGWQTLIVEDGNDLEAIEKAIIEAQAETTKPSLIAVKTIIGYGSPQEGTSKVHGSALGEENVRKTKEFFGWDPEKTFYVPEEVKEPLLEAGKKGAALEVLWNAKFEAYSQAYPEEAKMFNLSFSGKLPEDWDGNLPTFKAGESLATRQASGKALEALKNAIPWIIGGSADLASSNDTPTQSDISFQPGHYGNSNIWFGVREHAMGAILNGMASHSGVRVYGGTFLTFSDYMRGAIRLAALTQAPVTYIFTHDSVGLGEDGPTHQPVEQVTALRAIPGLTVIRPADANETVEAWRIAIQRTKEPVALILSRQKLPVIDQTKYAPASNVAKGAYILSESNGVPSVILIATGSEVQLIVAAQEKLKQEGIEARVVSMPSFELFEKQDQAYKESVFPPSIHARLAVEAGVTQAWWKYVTAEGDVIGIDRFGESGVGEEVLIYFGFTVENVVNKAKALIKP